MTDADLSPSHPWRCANCRRPLSKQTAVCPYCEPEFSAPALNRKAGRMHLPPLHLCPVCAKGFDIPASRLEPETAPWWRPQIDVWCCPHCRTRLMRMPDTLSAQSERWASLGSAALASVLLIMNWIHYKQSPAMPLSSFIAYGLMALNVCAMLWAAGLRNLASPHDSEKLLQRTCTATFDACRFEAYDRQSPIPWLRALWQSWPLGMLAAIYLAALWYPWPAFSTTPLAIAALFTVVAYAGLYKAQSVRNAARKALQSRLAVKAQPKI